jgi:sugar/nucleoside kinase (ribokinase family)
MVGAVGNDDFGTALLAGRGVDRSAVATLSGVGSGMSVAIFDAEGDYGRRTASMRSGRTATRATGPRSAQPGRTRIKKGCNVKLDYLPLNGAEIVIREPRSEGDR